MFPIDQTAHCPPSMIFSLWPTRVKSYTINQGGTNKQLSPLRVAGDSCPPYGSPTSLASMVAAERFGSLTTEEGVDLGVFSIRLLSWICSMGNVSLFGPLSLPPLSKWSKRKASLLLIPVWSLPSLYLRIFYSKKREKVSLPRHKLSHLPNQIALCLS